METAVANKQYSIEEYLCMEDRSVEKHEFYNGKIVKMPGGTFNHNLIATNVTTALNDALEAKKSNCFVLNSDMKIFVPQILTFVYPDAVVVCERPEFHEGREDIITNPLLIVEVLSPSSETYDRTNKFYYYKQIPSFKEYVLVAQSQPFVIASYKIAERTWRDSEVLESNASIYLPSIDCSIALSKIYKGVVFAAQP